MKPRRSGDRAPAASARARRTVREASPRSLAEVGEFGFLASFLPSIPAGSTVRVGPGDDAAVLRPPGHDLVLTTDALVEGTHFRREWLSPYELGRKALIVNASDVAAMGARPLWCVVSVGVPATTAERDLTDLQRGLRDACVAYGADLVGGNLARSPQWFVSVTLAGRLSAAPPLLRRGARVGDAVYVSGTLGDAALAVSLWQATPAQTPPAAVRRRFVAPTARVDLGCALARAGLATAAIDVSDGLLQDLGHLCAASGVGAEVEVERLPVSRALRRHPEAFPKLALMGGEDYELLWTAPAAAERRLAGLAARGNHPVRRIGRIVAGSGVGVLDGAGRPVYVAGGGHDHFAPSPLRRTRRKS